MDGTTEMLRSPCPKHMKIGRVMALDVGYLGDHSLSMYKPERSNFTRSLPQTSEK